MNALRLLILLSMDDIVHMVGSCALGRLLGEKACKFHR